MLNYYWKETMSTLTQAAQDYILAKAALDAAEKAKQAAEQALKMEMAVAGVEFAVAGGQKVSLENKTRVSYDPVILGNLVSTVVFLQVTKPTVDSELLRAAVAMGHVPADAASAAEKKTSYTSIRITNLNKVATN